jgi:molybdopterin synthase sulfur carrier subunit
MTIHVRFFASLREQMQCAEARIEAPTGITVAEVWQQIAAGRPLPANALMAVNLEYADAGQQVRDGDEVAFFPPVTGGAR